MENLDIRLLLHENGILHKELAAAIGIREDSFSRLMRKPLSAWQRERILAAVDILQERKQRNA